MPFDTTYSGRFDSGSANNPALNLTGDPAIEFTFAADGPNGDLILDGGAEDLTTVVVIDGVSYNFTFELTGTMPTTNNNGANQVPEQFEGSEVYLITVIDYPIAGETTRLAFMPNEDATLADMDAFGNGAIDIQGVNTTPSGGTICFLIGTQINTPDGPVMIDDLAVGDLVMTADHGAMPIAWIGRSSHTWPGSDDRARPILISAGAMGNDLPQRDLIVSPQHRILLSGQTVQAACDTDEVLVPAKALTDLPGIRDMKGRKEATYVHLMLGQHAVIEAEGLPTESFYPGASALRMMSAAHKREILALFPRIMSDPETTYGKKARLCLSVRQTRELLAKRDVGPKTSEQREQTITVA